MSLVICAMRAAARWACVDLDTISPNPPAAGRPSRSRESANCRWSTHSSRRARAAAESASRLDARELGALVGKLHLKPTTGGYHCRHAGGCVASLSPSGARLHAAMQRRAADADTREWRRAAGATLQWYVPHHGAESAAGVTSRRTEIRPRAIARRGKRGLHATGRPSGCGACNHGCCGVASQTSRTRERAEPVGYSRRFREARALSNRLENGGRGRRAWPFPPIAAVAGAASCTPNRGTHAQRCPRIIWAPEK